VVERFDFFVIEAYKLGFKIACYCESSTKIKKRGMIDETYIPAIKLG